MMSERAAMEKAMDLVHVGELPDINSANVAAVRMMGCRIIRAKIPSSVRKALNAAVKEGYLGHLKKDGLKPEAYFHPNSRQNAISERNRIERESVRAICQICQ